ncbi:MAG: hypothetical protein ACR2FO_03945 [Actinomycetota bacterium]
MSGSPYGVAKLERLEAILRSTAIYELGKLVPSAHVTAGGRRRRFPGYAFFFYEALISVYSSARQVEAELSHPVVWRFARRLTKKLFPAEPEMWLPRTPIRRHHYLYARNRYLQESKSLKAIASLHRQIAANQARELGLMDPKGPGTWTSPDPTRLVHADGKVITPLFKAKPGEVRVNKQTGEARDLQFEPDAGLHFEGTGETAWGTKFVIVAARSGRAHGRIILDVEWVAKPGAEAAGAMDSLVRLAPAIPGAQAVVYDNALRGVHHQRLLRELGLMPINRVAALAAGEKKSTHTHGDRVEKSVHVESRKVKLADGSVRTYSLYALGGAIGLGELTDGGELEFVELKRLRTLRLGSKAGAYRWYNEYRLPPEYGAEKMRVRLYGNAEDKARRFNRTENIRPISPTEPAFKKLFGRRNDCEAINRDLVDSMWLGRAHSVGHARQHLNLIGYAVMVNALALHQHRKRREDLAAA